MFYSDGVTEATNLAGTELGEDTLMALARSLDPSSPETFGRQLAEAIGQFREGRVPEDDETIMVVERSRQLA